MSEPIFDAIKSGDIAQLNTALQASGAASARGEMNITPLMLAASLGNLEMVRALLKAGAEVKAVDERDYTALFYGENGATSPSLGSLQALGKALQVPVTALFKGFEETRDATFVKAGQGLTIERRGTRAGHQYQLLGHSPHGPVMVEPYLITLTDKSDVFPTFQHAGLEFLYMLEGNVVYRHGDKTYDMHPGDALFFDADAPHGPEELRELPIRYLSVISYRREE